VKGNTATLEIQLDKLTVDRVNRGMADPWDTDSYRNGPAGDRPKKIEGLQGGLGKARRREIL